MGSAYFGELAEFTKNFLASKPPSFKKSYFSPFLLSGWAHTTSYWPSVAHFNNVSVDLSVFSGSLGTYSLPAQMSPRPAHYWLCDIHCLTRSSHREGRGGGGVWDRWSSLTHGLWAIVAHTMILFLSANWSTKWISWSLVWCYSVHIQLCLVIQNALWSFFDLLKYYDNFNCANSFREGFQSYFISRVNIWSAVACN